MSDRTPSPRAALGEAIAKGIVAKLDALGSKPQESAASANGSSNSSNATPIGRGEGPTQAEYAIIGENFCDQVSDLVTTDPRFANWSPAESYEEFVTYLLERLDAAEAAASPPVTAQEPVAGPLFGKYGDVLRPFVALMEAELHANSGKGDRPGWLQMDRKTALLEIFYHLSKLQKAAKDDDQNGIREYAADVANMALMLVDVCGALPAASPHPVSAEAVAWNCIYPTHGHFTLKKHEAEQAEVDGATVRALVYADVSAERKEAEELYLLTAGPDGAHSKLVYASDLKRAVIETVFGDPDEDSEEAVRFGEMLDDDDEWNSAPDYPRWAFAQTFEDGYLAVQLVTDLAALRGEQK